MTKSISERLDQIKTEWCDIETFKCIYGLDINSEDSKPLKESFRQWQEQSRRKNNCFHENETKVNRWLFELFLQHNNLITTLMAGIEVSMLQNDFINLLDKMQQKGMILGGCFFDCKCGVIPEPIVSNLQLCFNSLKFKSFWNTSEYIEILHKTITQELDMQFNPVRPFLSDIENGYATEYDIITGKPFESRDQVWLDFGKPIALKPDICSIYTYVMYKHELEGYLFSQESIDEDDIQKAKVIIARNNV